MQPIHRLRQMGKSFDVATMLFKRIEKAEEYILFKSHKKTVHIFPEDKLEEYVQGQIFRLFTEGGENLAHQFRGRRIKLTPDQAATINHSIKICYS